MKAVTHARAGVATVFGALLSAFTPSSSGCAGTEQAIFVLVDDRSIDVPAPAGLAGSPAPDAGPDAAQPPTQDSGSEPDEDGGAVVDPGLDPSVTFTWTQTLPGRGTCREGSYAGSFTAVIDPPDLLALPITGELAVLLQASPEQQKLSVAEGTLEGPLFLAPALEGAVDCPTRAFSAVSVDGTDFTGQPFAASLHGALDVDTLVLEGEVILINALNQVFRGTFRAGIAP